MNANRVDSVDCCLSERTSDSPALSVSQVKQKEVSGTYSGLTAVRLVAVLPAFSARFSRLFLRASFSSYPP